MNKKTLLCLLVLLAAVMTANAQTTVTTHWPLNTTIKDLTVGSTAYNNATAPTFSYEGTELKDMFATSVTFGSKMAFQAVITPASYATKEVTGLGLLRFKVQGAADGTDDYGMLLNIAPTAELTYLPTRVSVSVASWVKDSKAAFEVLLRKLNSTGEVSQTYELGTVNSHPDVDAHYDDVSFDVPATATASSDRWQVVVRMVKGYQNGKNLAMGNVTLVGTATLGGSVQTSSFTATVVPEGAGSVKPATTEVVTGDNVTCTATANIGYAFEGWYVGGTLVASDNPHTFKIAANTQVEARFTKLPEATLTYGVAEGSAGMGTVSISPEGDTQPSASNLQRSTYNAGTSVTLTATAAKGHYFVRWENGDGKELSTSEQYTFTLNSDQTVNAVFAMIDNYESDLIAFPGAEGYGRFTTGGRMFDKRGAKVYYVTRNDDCPDNALVEGTLRWALKTGDDTPRTILFRTCGTIYLTSNLSLNHPNITIAGQTAPGGGICIAGYQMKLNQPNIIIRHIRFRAGDLPNSSMSPLDVENTHHIVLDHCSFSWSMEENLTLYDTDYTTLQWCISAEGLYYSKNVKGERSYAMQWGGEHGTMHHCLVSNCMSRMPRFNGARPSTNDRHVDNEFANNVIFNFGKNNSVYGGECTVTGDDYYNRVYMINNYFRPGPQSKQNTASHRYFVSGTGSNINELGQWYLKGNKFEISSRWAPSSNIWTDTELQKVNADNYYGFVSNNASRAMNFWSVSPSQAVADKALLTELPYALSGLEYETADEAYRSVTQQAGASLPRYDEVDRRLLAEAAGTQDPQFGGMLGKYGIIDSPADITLSRYDEFYALDEATGQTIKTQMWPWLGMDDDEQLMQDSDLDGMPDDYETSVGLNPNDATDACRLTASGYSNLEVFLNGVADGTIDQTPYKTAQAVEKHQLFDAIVDPSTSVPGGSPSGLPTFTTIQAAVTEAEQKATKETPYYILVKAGTYNEHVEISNPYIHLTGVSREQVVITDNKSKSYNGNIGKTATVYVNASDVSLDNLTIRNTYGSGEQALALYTLGDRITVTQCRIEGWQDTYRTGKSGQRHLVRECRISGTTDFIYNAGDVFFDRDTLALTNTTNVIVAPSHINPTWGYVFRDAYITQQPIGYEEDPLPLAVTTDLGRPWGDTPMVSFIDTRLAGGVSITAAGWRNMDGLPVQMAEYNTMDATGQAVDLSKRKTTFTANGKSATSKAVLTEAEAAAYTIQNVLSGTDQWDADAAGRILPEPRLTVGDGQLSWSDTSRRAVCYLVITNGQAAVTTDETAAYTAGTTVSIQCVSENGVLGRVATVDAQGNIHSGISTVNRTSTSGTYYSLTGQRLSQPRRGVNIASGRKFLVK